MTQASTPRPPQPPRPGPAPAIQGGALGAVQIDPVRLVRKYFWVLIATGIIAVVLGVATFIVLGRVAPSFRATATFRATAPKVNIGTAVDTEKISTQELERFMGTQAAIMTSEVVLESVATHPQLSTRAPTYFQKFSTGGGVDVPRVVRDLSDRTGARPLPRSELIELSVSYSNPVEATELLRLVRTTYQERLQQNLNIQSAGQLATIRRLRDDAEREARRLETQRNRLVQESAFDTLEDRTSEVAQTIGRLTEEMLEIGLQLEALNEQLESQERQLTNDAGIQFGDDLVSNAEQNPRVANLRQQIDSLETALRSFRERGYTDRHRDVLQIHASIAATRQRLEQTRTEVMEQLFLGQVEQTRRFIAQLEAQQADLNTQIDEARLRRNELVRLATQVTTITQRIQTLEAQRAEWESNLQNLVALAQTEEVDRIQLIEPERIPDSRAFPQLRIVVPGVFVLVCGAVGSLILLREILDQRVKSPADVAMIPKARVLGMIPVAREDTVGNDNVETIFRDYPRGVLAESYRQLRGTLFKRLQQTGHTSIVVVPASPGSGASSIVCNLGLSAAAAHRRVLIIDGNFRRPALHAIFDLRDGPGLADILGGGVAMSAAVQASGTPNLDVLTVGSAESRQYELLSTPKFGEVIAEAAKAYDLVFIDAPPAVVSGDGVSMAQRCDASILVARAMNEKRGMIARLRTELDESRADLLGIVVNAVRAAAGGYMRDNIRLTRKYQAGDQVGGSIDRDAQARRKKAAMAPVGADDDGTPINPGGDASDSDRA